MKNGKWVSKIVGSDDEGKKKLQDLFYEDAALMSAVIESMCKGVKAFSKSEPFEDFCMQAIDSEKKQDRVREEILGRMYTRETMVFSREDRMGLVYRMDDVADAAERVAMRLSMYKPKALSDVLEGIGLMGEMVERIGKNLAELIEAVFKDFDPAEDLIKKITDDRRDVRAKEYELLKSLYGRGLNASDLVFYEDLVTNLAKVGNEAEEFADIIWTLISKYTL